MELKIRTIAYIDGFNFYFGCLKGTPYRWLDLERLVGQICHEQNPKNELIMTKYFTADIKAKLSEHGHYSCIAQQDYLLSLKARSKRLEIIKGKYALQCKHYYAYADPVDFSIKHSVWQAEEKQTDVNIAVHSLCDAIDDECEQIIYFSNDSDLAPVLDKIRLRKPSITIGVVAPIRDSVRRPSSELKLYADWTRDGIKETELRNAQLPLKVTTRKRIINKPEHW